MTVILAPREPDADAARRQPANIRRAAAFAGALAMDDFLSKFEAANDVRTFAHAQFQRAA